MSLSLDILIQQEDLDFLETKSDLKLKQLY